MSVPSRVHPSVATLPFALLIAGCELPPERQIFRANGEIIALGGGDGGPDHACFTCHGMNGEGDGRLAPRLAGLDAGYVQRQLDDYATGRRVHEAMRAVARRLDHADRERVADYYAGLSGPRLVSAAPVEGPGRRLYLEGDPARGIAACASCHGDVGEGVGAANPPLAGQPRAYLEAQLQAWRRGKRFNDPLGEMRLVSRRLSPSEVVEVSAYAASLAPSSPPSRSGSMPSSTSWRSQK